MYDFPLSGVFAKQLPSQNQVPFSVRSLVSFWVVLPIFLYWNPMVFTAKYLVVVDLLQSHIRYYQSNFCDTKPTACGSLSFWLVLMSSCDDQSSSLRMKFTSSSWIVLNPSSIFTIHLFERSSMHRWSPHCVKSWQVHTAVVHRQHRTLMSVMFWGWSSGLHFFSDILILGEAACR